MGSSLRAKKPKTNKQKVFFYILFLTMFRLDTLNCWGIPSRTLVIEYLVFSLKQIRTPELNGHRFTWFLPFTVSLYQDLMSKFIVHYIVLRLKLNIMGLTQHKGITHQLFSNSSVTAKAFNCSLSFFSFVDFQLFIAYPHPPHTLGPPH